MSHPYLEISIEEPQAALRAKRWRVHCRRLRQGCLIVMRAGPTFALELRNAPGSPAQLDIDMLAQHPHYEYLHSGSTVGGRNYILFDGMPTSKLDEIIAVASDLLETCGSEDMRQALRRREDPLPLLSDQDPYSDFIESEDEEIEYEVPYPRLQLRFPDAEYECWQACLRQIFDMMPRPLPVTPRTAIQREISPEIPLRLDLRFDGLCAQVDEQWRAGLVASVIEPRFEPGLVELKEGGMLISRPGFSRDGQQAAFWLRGPLLTGRFDGMVRAEKNEKGWRVAELSYDDDWEYLYFEPFPRPPDTSEGRPVAEWRWACATYAEPSHPDASYTHGEWELCERQFAELAAGEDSRSVIPMLHGPALSIQQVRRMGHERGEILWSNRKSKVSTALATTGHPVVLWGTPDDPEWLGKLLYHLDQTIPCRRLESTWVAPPREDQPNAHRQSLLKLMEAVFRRAGCAPLRFRHWPGESGLFAWQDENRGPARICGYPGIFDREGTLWVHISQHGFDDRVFELLGSLCAWGDPELRWTRKLWRAAQIESAWSGIEEN